MCNIAHIAYSGVGGLAEVCLTLLTAARQEVDSADRHTVGFYGVESLVPRYAKRCESLDVDHTYFEKRRGFDLRASWRIARWLRQRRPDVVITHMTQTFVPFVLYWFANPKARLVIVEHHSNALKRAKDWGFTLVNHWLASATIYLTEQYREQVKQKLGPLLVSRKVNVIPNGLDIEAFCPNAERRSQAGDLVIGMQGRMTATKDYRTLLQSFAKLCETPESNYSCRLEIAGDGPMRAELESLATQLGVRDRVGFLGLLTQEEMIERLQSWDMFVLSTHGETMSRALMEAQSCGLPLIASDVSGVSAAVDHRRTGLLVPPRNADALAEAMRELVSNADLRRELGIASREHAVSHFSADQCWRRYREIINKVVA